jgi:Ca2+-binding EF-hand superfamily protein
MVSGISGLGMSTTQMWQDLLQRADSDGDGRISKDEFAADKPQDRQGRGPAAEDIFTKMDADGDGYVTEEESTSFLESMQAMSAQAMSLQAMKPPSPDDMFEEADADGNGELTEDELAAVAPKDGSGPSTGEVFSSMDTNEDGVVSPAEFAAAMAKMMHSSQALAQQSTLSVLA